MSGTAARPLGWPERRWASPRSAARVLRPARPALGLDCEWSELVEGTVRALGSWGVQDQKTPPTCAHIPD